MSNLVAGIRAVSTDIVSVRESIPCTVSSLNQWFVARGWAIRITNLSHIHAPGQRFEITAERSRWLGMLSHGYEWSYVSAEHSSTSVIATIRKLAEFCQQLEEVFHDTYPNAFVHDDGCVYEDVKLGQLSEMSSDVRLKYLTDALHARYKPSEKTISIRSGFLRVSWGEPYFLMGYAELKQLEECLHERSSG